jgi:chromate transporter
MKDEGLALVQIVVLFTSLSVLSIGGGNSVLPEMHRKAVADYGWVTDAQFANVFAISQAAPGPSILIVTMLGYEAGARAGGLALGSACGLLATVCMIVPAGILVYLVGSAWARAAESPWRHAIERGLAPLTVGLVLASGWVMAQASDHGIAAYTLTALCTVIFTTTKVNPLWVVAAAGFVGYLGWV